MKTTDTEKKAGTLSIDSILAEYGTKKPPAPAKEGQGAPPPESEARVIKLSDVRSAPAEALEKPVEAPADVQKAPEESPAAEADIGPSLSPEDVSLNPDEEFDIIDLATFDSVYQKKQLRIKKMRSRLLARRKEAQKHSRKEPRPAVVPSKIKTGPLPIPANVKRELDARRTGALPPLDRVEPDREVAKEPAPGKRAAQAAKKPRARINPQALLSKTERRRVSSGARAVVALLVLLAMAGIALLSSLGLSPEKLDFAADPRTASLVLLALLLLSCAAGYDVILSGLSGLFTLRPGSDLLVLLSALSSACYCGSVFLYGAQPQYVPVCILPAASVFVALWGRKSTARSYARSLKSAVRVKKVKALAPMPDRYDGEVMYSVANAGGLQGFYAGMTAPHPAEGAMRLIAPLLAVSALFIAVYSSTMPEEGPPFLWCWSLLSACIPALGFFLCDALPYSGLSKRLFRCGVLLGGKKALFKTAGRSFVLLTDSDVFPAEAISINGFMIPNPALRGTAIACTASVLEAAHTEAAIPFAKLAAESFVSIRPVLNLEFNDAGGYIATVDGKHVMVGSASFIQRSGIRVPPGIKNKTSVLCAIDAELAAVFSVNYNALPKNDYALTLLAENGYIPVLATRDANITSSLLQAKFGIPSSDIIYPATELRVALSDPGRRMEPCGVVITRGSGDTAAEALVASSRYRSAFRAGFAFSLVSAVVGLGLCALIAFNAWGAVASPLNLLSYYSLWLLPVLLISGWANKF